MMNSSRLVLRATRSFAARGNPSAGQPKPLAAAFCTQKATPALPVAPLKAPPVKEKTPVAQAPEKMTVFGAIKNLKDAPSPALLYGISGLIPFVAVPIYTISSGTFCPLMGSMQLYYGASILSFLGGVRWGKALESPNEMTMQNLGFSVVPSLAACGALALPYPAAMAAVSAGLGGAAYLDLHSAKSTYPPWFKSLRLVLSSVAVASLLSGLALSYTHKKEEESKEQKQ